LSFVEIGTNIFVLFIYFIEYKLWRAFLSKSQFHESLIFELRPKHDFERLEPQKCQGNILPNDLFFLKRASYASKARFGFATVEPNML
jgi:hypothetical protein